VCLKQTSDGQNWHVVAYGSKALDKAQLNWSATDHKGYIIMFFLNKWRHLLLTSNWRSCWTTMLSNGCLTNESPLARLHSGSHVKLSDKWITKLQEAQQIIHDQVMVSQDQAKKEMVLQHSTWKGGSYMVGDLVLVQQPMKGQARKLVKKWTGLFNVIQQASPQVIVLHHPKGHNFKLNME
jgi:hypothetical protein